MMSVSRERDEEIEMLLRGQLLIWLCTATKMKRRAGQLQQ